jgi:hypothetical protein
MQTFLIFKWVVPASKCFEKALMRMMYLLLKGRGRWAQVLKVHMGVATLIHQLLLVAPLAKVTVPAPSKHINQMTTMMTMKTSLWTRFLPLSLGPHGPSSGNYDGHSQDGGLYTWISQRVQGKVQRSLTLAKGVRFGYQVLAQVQCGLV